jgi:hypothetical protein
MAPVPQQLELGPDAAVERRGILGLRDRANRRKAAREGTRSGSGP